MSKSEKKVQGPQSFFADLFTTRGRICRHIFWRYMLIYVAGCLIVSALGRALNGLSTILAQLVVILLYLPLAAAALCQTVRRYHDFNVSGWVPGGFMLLCFLEYIVSASLQVSDSLIAWTSIFEVCMSAAGLALLFLVPALVPGNRITNRYGMRP